MEQRLVYHHIELSWLAVILKTTNNTRPPKGCSGGMELNLHARLLAFLGIRDSKQNLPIDGSGANELNYKYCLTELKSRF